MGRQRSCATLPMLSPCADLSPQIELRTRWCCPRSCRHAPSLCLSCHDKHVDLGWSMLQAVGGCDCSWMQKA